MKNKKYLLIALSIIVTIVLLLLCHRNLISDVTFVISLQIILVTDSFLINTMQVNKTTTNKKYNKYQFIMQISAVLLIVLQIILAGLNIFSEYAFSEIILWIFIGVTIILNNLKVQNKELESN